MRAHYKAVLIASIITMIVFLTLLSSKILDIERHEGGTLSVTNSASAYDSDFVSDGEEVGELVPIYGDAGISDEEELSILSPIPVEVSAATKKEMVSFILSYLGYIPFADQGRFYGTGYFKSPDGVDNRIQTPVGVDSLGYVIWVYRNVFASSSPAFNEPEGWPQQWQQITVTELEIGDIGVYQDPSSTQNHYGVFVGHSNGFPVFAHCSGVAAPKYPCGNDRLAFLKSVTQQYYMGNAPVDFHYFFRPMVDWEMEEDR